MRYLKIVLSSVGLLLGSGAVFLSLSFASQVSSHESARFTARELYWGQEMLPDHLLYPVLMAVDRVQLEQAASTERVYMQVVYAGRRLVYAQELLKKEKPQLAVTTLTKSQKYLLQAAHEVLGSDLRANDELVTYLLKAYTFHERELERMKTELPEQERAVVDGLCSESHVLMEQLQETLAH